MEPSDNTAELLSAFERGVELIRQGDFSRAQLTFEAARTRFGEVAVLYQGLGMASFYAGQTEKAFENFRKANSLDPDNADIAVNLAEAGLKLGLSAELRGPVERALSLHPADADLARVAEEILKTEAQRMPPEIRGSLDLARGLRLSGKYIQALGELQKAFSHLSNAEILAEGIRILILLDMRDQAFKLYNLLSAHPDAARFLEAEFLLRLQEMRPEEPMPALKLPELRTSTDWARETIAGRLPVEPVIALSRLRFDLLAGPTFMTFDCLCPHCRHAFELEVNYTFLVSISVLCPNCLGKQHLSHHVLRLYFEKHHPALLNEPLDAKRALINETEVALSRPMQAADPVPLLCRYLNRRYVFFLNQKTLEGIAKRSA